MNPANERGRGLDSPDPIDYAALKPTSHHEDTAEAKAQGDLLQLLAEQERLAARARDAGLESTERNDPDWCRRVSEWIYDLPPGYEFDADEIRSRFGASNASGPIINTAARRHVIVHVGWTKSTAITRHGSDIKVWRRT